MDSPEAAVAEAAVAAVRLPVFKELSCDYLNSVLLCKHKCNNLLILMKE